MKPTLFLYKKPYYYTTRAIPGEKKYVLQIQENKNEQEHNKNNVELF